MSQMKYVPSWKHDIHNFTQRMKERRKKVSQQRRIRLVHLPNRQGFTYVIQN